MSDYVFDSAFPPGHFVADYIAYASDLCDAAHDYHEACALILLAIATPDVFARLKQFPAGLRTNLYVALVGETSTSRKSTAKDITIDTIKAAFPHVLLPDKSTPEAFASNLAGRKRQAALWPCDEYAALLKQIHRREYLAGLESMLLELYQHPDYTYKRVKDVVEIRESHLSVLGCAAFTLFDSLHQEDIESGLLPRHAIILPTTKPDYMAFAEMSQENLSARNALVKRLVAIAPQCDGQGAWLGQPREARFTTAAFQAVDVFAQAHQGRYPGEMQARIVPMLLKIGLLSALGDPRFLLNGTVLVDADDIVRASS